MPFAEERTWVAAYLFVFGPVMVRAPNTLP